MLQEFAGYVHMQRCLPASEKKLYFLRVVLRISALRKREDEE